MSFTRAQQPAFRAVVEDAWRSHCTASAGAVQRGDKIARRAWYEAALLDCAGVESTTALNPTRDYEEVMAHFEAIAGESIYWQMRLYTGDARRIFHEIERLCSDHGLDEDYLRAIARQCLGLGEPPELHKLPADVLLIVLRSVKIQLAREKKIAHGWAGGAIPTPRTVTTPRRSPAPCPA